MELQLGWGPRIWFPSSMMTDRLAWARESLEGLSVGDAIGEALSYAYHEARQRADFSAFRPGTVRYTDDTEMALGIVDLLSREGGIAEDSLAKIFAARYRADPHRGYGRMARKILDDLALGRNWEDVSKAAFGGGSFGNGAAMRVAPLGAYFHDDLERVVVQATRSARVTHAHPEGIAGAIAVAVAAATAAETRTEVAEVAAARIRESVRMLTPDGECRRRLEVAFERQDRSHFEVAREVGNGVEISAMDTVPFCIWNASRCLNDYREGILSSIEIDGDCDTNAAIVGGIIAARSGSELIPRDWREARESLACF